MGSLCRHTDHRADKTNVQQWEEKTVKWLGHTQWTRNRFLQACLIMPATYLLGACTRQSDGDGSARAAAPAPASTASGATTSAVPVIPATPGQSSVAQPLPPTPECGDADDVTPAQTEGPYFTPNSPERTSLVEPDMAGRRLVVTGSVLTTACQPVAGALLDFWQADDAGVYDNAGFRLRGHQFTDEAGHYQLETVVPGLYPGRTRHIHVKVQASNQPILTTQLYFPNEPRNAQDGIFHPSLVMAVQEDATGMSATFNFVLNVT